MRNRTKVQVLLPLALLLVPELSRLLLPGAGTAMSQAMAAQRQEGDAAPQAQGIDVAVYGPEGAHVSLDGQAVGDLPLAEPLSVPPGNHKLDLEKGGRRVAADIELMAGRPVEVRFTLVPPLAVVTPTRAAILLADYDSVPAPFSQQLERMAGRSAAEERVLVLSRDKLSSQLAASPGLGDCLGTVPCQERLAAQVAAQYVLQLRVETQRQDPGKRGQRDGLGDWRLAVTLHDVEAGAAGAQRQDACTGCDLAQVTARLGDLVGQVVREGVTRPRGTLEVATVPGQALVAVDGRDVGRAPVRRDAFTGLHKVLVEAPGYVAQHRDITVQSEQVALLQVTLQQVPPPPPVPVVRAAPVQPVLIVDERRPGLRAGKWAVGAAGVGQLIVAATLWGLDGAQSCPKARIGHCPYEFNGQSAGIGLAVSGGLTLGIAGLLFYLDARRDHRERPNHGRTYASALPGRM